MIDSRIPEKVIEPEKPYKYAAPKRKKAEANEPRRKYFSADSCEAKRRLRESPAIKYNGNDSTSRATKSMIKSLAIGKIIIPETANKVSG